MKNKMVKIGTVIRGCDVDSLTKKKTYKRWTVKKIYPYMVLCVDENGFRTCFSINELILLGMVKQSPELEVLKDARNAQYINYKMRYAK